jgi:membrane protease YdiL (CAAX protease family)
MRTSLLKAILFAAAAVGLLMATGPLVGVLAALTGSSTVPAWIYSALFATLLLAATGLALRLDGSDLDSLGLAPTRRRIREFTLGLALGTLLFAMLALVRGATVGAVWSLTSSNGATAAFSGLATAFLLLLPEELLFRGYALQRLVRAVGTWPAILFSAVLFGVYHVVGSGMWGMGAFFRLAMPMLGGVVFGWASVRTKGLALPTGLHLAGNWVQASVFSFQLPGESVPKALWTAYVTEIQQRFLHGPDFGAHVPYVVTTAAAMLVVRLVFPPLERTA